MGPRARARGNQVTTYAMLHAPWLQWGHERALVEIVIYVVARMNGCSASMGPRARARGNKDSGGGGVGVSELQWGHERALVEIGFADRMRIDCGWLQWGHERAPGGKKI